MTGSDQKLADADGSRCVTVGNMISEHLVIR